MDSRELGERLIRIEAKLDVALEKVSAHTAYLKMGAAIVSILMAQLVRLAWK